MAKVFVSHWGVDAGPTKRLAGQLRAAGYDIWLDAWEIEVGDPIIEKVDTGLGSADFPVLCLSVDAAGVHTTWMLREWAPTLARQLSGHNVTILPAALTGGRIPAILADIKTADLVTDWADGVRALLAAIDRRTVAPWAAPKPA